MIPAVDSHSMHHDSLDRAEEYLRQAGILDSPGKVLYAGASTLRPGPVYLLGLNPGGAEKVTIRESMDSARAEINAYLDEEWTPGGRLQPKGQAPLQRRVQLLCQMLGVDTRDMPASNLVFTRSLRLEHHPNFKAAIELCLPVHRIFLEAIQPAFLMTFGSLENFDIAFDVIEKESRAAEHANWKAHRGIAKLGSLRFNFGNIPHMSVWASDKRERVVLWTIEKQNLPVATE